MSVFRFKQFSVNQMGCAMKVNTDGVILGALAYQENPSNILDIGTGTGVIALMLAQRFAQANISAIELDTQAAETATGNFQQSPFNRRIESYAESFQSFFAARLHSKFDLIVSNPPFYLQSLPSPGASKRLAKHTDELFFAQLIDCCSVHLTLAGSLWLVLPPPAAGLVKQLAAGSGLYLQENINLQSYAHSEPHRQIMAFGKMQTEITQRSLVIYNAPKIYSRAYQDLLKDFLTIF